MSKYFTRIIIVIVFILALVLIIESTRVSANENENVLFIHSLNQGAMLVPTQWAKDAYPILFCESSMNPLKVGLAGERGLAQIHYTHIKRIEKLGYTWNDMFEPVPNLTVAISIWREQGNWSAWSCAHLLGIVK